MVVSEFRFIRGKGKIIVHYCNGCGSRYLNMEEARKCEFSHKSDITYSKNNDVVNLVNNQVIVFASDKIVQEDSKYHHTHNVIKYHAFVRGAFREKNYEIEVEASNIKEAAAKIREKFPRHSGYTLEPIK